AAIGDEKVERREQAAGDEYQEQDDEDSHSALSERRGRANGTAGLSNTGYTQTLEAYHLARARPLPLSAAPHHDARRGRRHRRDARARPLAARPGAREGGAGGTARRPRQGRGGHALRRRGKG